MVNKIFPVYFRQESISNKNMNENILRSNVVYKSYFLVSTHITLDKFFSLDRAVNRPQIPDKIVREVINESKILVCFHAYISFLRSW